MGEQIPLTLTLSRKRGEAVGGNSLSSPHWE